MLHFHGHYPFPLYISSIYTSPLYICSLPGKKFPPKELLQFAQGAVQAAQKELDALLGSYPPGWTDLVNSQLKAEEQQQQSSAGAADS
jgi:hypothetical protein